MKEYYVKIGKMYIEEIELNDDNISTNFIQKIYLTPEIKKYNYRVCEKDKENLRSILNYIFEFENEFTKIEFKELESESK